MGGVTAEAMKHAASQEAWGRPFVPHAQPSEPVQGEHAGGVPCAEHQGSVAAITDDDGSLRSQQRGGPNPSLL
jgi:hypothetical protein